MNWVKPFDPRSQEHITYVAGKNIKYISSGVVNEIIRINFIKKEGTAFPYWIVEILASTIPNYDAIVGYGSFNEKEFLKKVEELFILNEVKHCILDYIFNK